MAVETVIKQKGARTCANCNSSLSASATKCHNCGSSKIKKVRIVIKKTESTGEDAAPDTSDETTDDELTEDDFEGADDEDDTDDGGELEEEEDEDDEDDDEEEEEEPKVTKRVVRRRGIAKRSNVEGVNLDIALAALEVFDDISKAAHANDGDAYERSMNAFNNVCDEAFAMWATGQEVSKEDPAAKLKRLKAKLAMLKAKAGGQSGGDDDDSEDVGKSDEDIFKGMTPKAAAIVKRAQEIQERDDARKYVKVAKSFGLATPATELGAALRVLESADKKAYETVRKTLAGAGEVAKQSSIFKSFGSSNPGVHAEGETLDTIAKSIRDKDSSLSPEQAYAEAMRANPSLYDQALRNA